MTPGEGYLEAFTRENVELTMEGIERVDEKGVWTKDRKYWECDVLVCATGFDVSQRPTFPVVGRDGKELGEMWKGEAESYMVSHDITRTTIVARADNSCSPWQRRICQTTSSSPGLTQQ